MKIHLSRFMRSWVIGVAALFSAVSTQAQTSLPSIATGGVVSAGAFGGFTSIAPGSWIEIYGANLAIDSRSWAGSDFNGTNAPTSLDGTKVTVGGQLAFIDYISPGQVNAQVPSNVPTGSQQVIVTTAKGASTPYMVTVGPTRAGLLAPSSFDIGGKQFAVALFSDATTYVLPPGAIPGVPSRRAQPGDTITLYGIGFGPVVPNTPAGQVVQQNNTLASSFQLGFGTTSVGPPSYDGLAPSAVGLYQFNVAVPNVVGSDVPLTFSVGGVAGSQTLYIAVQPASITPQLETLTLSQASVAGGGTTQGTVTLSSSAPAGGVVVALSSNSGVVSVPATVTVPGGATSATFTVSASTVSSNQTVTVTATYAGKSIQASLTVMGGLAPQLVSMSINTSLTAPLAVSVAVVCAGTTCFANFNAAIPKTLLGTGDFSSVTLSGNTLIFSGFKPTDGLMTDPVGNLAQITSASLTITLTPQVVSTSGTASGSINLVSTLGTISGSFTGTFVTTN